MPTVLFPLTLLIFFIIYYLVNLKFKIYILFFLSTLLISILSISVAILSLLLALLNFLFGLAIEKYNNSNPPIKIKLFWVAVFFNIAILSFFKYFYFYVQDLNFHFFNTGIYAHFSYRSIMIPIGISYYTFQSLGYLIRISRGSEKAEPNFFLYATYLLFFPKFLSGPVERSNHFFPQLQKDIKFEQNNVEMGARLFLWGLLKKVVIADILFAPVSLIYGDVHSFTGLPLLILLFIQIIYIYCDFSGYTDMALGLAKCFGVNLIDNFNRPLLAKNISEFWRRWHISLSSWCNDFIYNPFIVKYRRFGNNAVITGIFLTFFVVGIWHGANLTFIILGLLQGIAIVYEFYTKRYRIKFASRFSKSTVNTWSRLIVFFFMTFSMTFFFSNSVSDAFYIISHLFSNFHFNIKELNFIENKSQFLISLACFIILFIFEILNEKGRNLLAHYLKQPFIIRLSGYIICIAMIYFFYSQFYPFYYMRF
jgi:D-alanyl-lipoteichoic acid acyltransferase DltB (MBOAT superfamily)